MTSLLFGITVLAIIIAGKWALLFLVAAIAEAMTGGENGKEGEEGDGSAW